MICPRSHIQEGAAPCPPQPWAPFASRKLEPQPFSQYIGYVLRFPAVQAMRWDLGRAWKQDTISALAEHLVQKERQIPTVTAQDTQLSAVR